MRRQLGSPHEEPIGIPTSGDNWDPRMRRQLGSPHEEPIGIPTSGDNWDPRMRRQLGSAGWQGEIRPSESNVTEMLQMRNDLSVSRSAIVS